MTEHLEQARHNEKFHDDLCVQFADQYFDWKITCLFYVCLHLIEALASKKRVDLGSNHNERGWNMNPRNPQRLLQIKPDVFDAFDALLQYSMQARYEGFTDFATFQILKEADYKDALRRCNYIKKYIAKQGVPYP